eukprot:485427-Hanusia_phi.AAC.5
MKLSPTNSPFLAFNTALKKFLKDIPADGSTSVSNPNRFPGRNGQAVDVGCLDTYVHPSRDSASSKEHGHSVFDCDRSCGEEETRHEEETRRRVHHPREAPLRAHRSFARTIAYCKMSRDKWAALPDRKARRAGEIQRC